MAKSGRSHDVLQQLLEERKRYEQWLAALESRRDSTPEHVYMRVHGDYEGRLAAVRDQLTQRTSEIRTAVGALKDRLKQATEEESARTDELHEAELRATVGEFTAEQWELRRREVEVDLKQVADEKKKISDELNQLLLIIEQTGERDEPAGGTTETQLSEPASPAPRPAATSATDTPPPPPMEPPRPAPPPAQPVLPRAAPVPADGTRVSRKTPARPRPATQAGPVPTLPLEEEKTPVSIESLAPADGLPAKVPDSTRAPAQAAPAAPAAPATAASDARGSSHGKRGKPGSFAPAQPDPRRENEKTLKCAECGAMNYPTEWYCESCGGELSAL